MERFRTQFVKKYHDKLFAEEISKTADRVTCRKISQYGTGIQILIKKLICCSIEKKDKIVNILSCRNTEAALLKFYSLI